MLENWHQMDGNWLETIKHVYSAHMRLLPFSWFSMKLGMINSFSLCVLQWFKKYLGWGNFTKFLTKISHNGYKQHLGKNALHLQYIQEKILQ